MQSIERYGIVALLFLVATFTAVLVMGEEAPPEDAEVARAATRPAPAAAPEPRAPAARTPEPRGPAGTAEEPRVQLRVKPRAQGITRDGFAEVRSAELQEAARAEEARRAAEAAARAAEVASTQGTPRAGFAPHEASLLERPGSAPAPAVEERRPATPSAAAPASGDPGTYVVRSGDTLGEIAQRELGTCKVWRRIVDANPGLDPAKLHVGQKLRMPGRGGEAPAPARAAATGSAPARKGESYTVQPGDSLWRIAARTLGDGKRYREIAALNPGIDPDRVTVGSLLVLPAGARPREAAAPRNAAPIVASTQTGRAADTSRQGGRVR